MRLAYHKPLKYMALLLSSVALDVQAEPLQLRVQDEAGAPLADAVLMAPGARPTPPATPAIMDQVNKTFVPHVLVVEQGRSVHFPNSDDIRHHVYSFSKPKPFEIKLYEGSQQAVILFDKPGIVALGCNIHDGMAGYIVVSDTQNVAQTDTNGKATLEVTDRNAPIRAWHPLLLKGNQAAVDMPLPAASNGVITITLSVLAPSQPEHGHGFSNRFRTHAR